jgi:hypothetical protein
MNSSGLGSDQGLPDLVQVTKVVSSGPSAGRWRDSGMPSTGMPIWLLPAISIKAPSIHLVGQAIPAHHAEQNHRHRLRDAPPANR